jgi:hypothetical protein
MNWQGQDIKQMPDDALKALKDHLKHLADTRAATQHNNRTAKFKIDFSSSENGYYNTLLATVNSEIETRKI